MKVREYISSKYQSYGINLSEADLLDMAQDAVLIDKTNDDYCNDGGYDVLQTFYLNDFLNEVFYFAHLTLDRNICKGINFNYIPNRFL